MAESPPVYFAMSKYLCFVNNMKINIVEISGYQKKKNCLKMGKKPVEKVRLTGGQ